MLQARSGKDPGMREDRGLRLAARLLLATLAVAAGGCAGVVAPGTRTAVDASLSELNEARNRQAIEQILRSDEVLRATRGLTRAVIDEALSGGGPGSDARLAALSGAFARDIAPALGRTVDDVVLPRVQSAVASAVRTALDQALGDENRQRIGKFTADVAHRTVASVAPQIESSISHGITSAVERILQHDLSPAIGKALDDNTAALARTTRAMTVAALDGVNDAMAGPFGDMFRKERQATIAQVQAAEAQQQRALAGEIEKQVADSRRWFETLIALFVVVGAALLGVGVLLWRVLAAHRELLRRTPGNA
jgi:hypothetical protein